MKLLDLCRTSTERVESRNDFCFWQVDQYKLDNKHLTMWYEKEFNSTARFVYRDYDHLKYALSDARIDLDHDYHLDFLKNLRSKNKTVKLMYSGGTDSATILDLAHQHDITIDETITLVIQDIDYPSNTEQKNIVMPSLEKYRQVINKASVVVYTHEEIERHFEDKYAFFSGPCDAVIPVGFTAAKYTALEPYMNQEGACVISGIDKPEVLYYNGKWYATCVDSAVAWGDQSIKNLVPFYMDAGNIKGYVKDCLLFRNYIIEKQLVNNKSFQFFQPDQSKEHSRILGRLEIQGAQHQLTDGKFSTINEKTLLRFKECLGRNKFTTLIKYFEAAKTFYSVFPEAESEAGLSKYHNNGKFAWFIDLDSLEVYSPKELIPNGFCYES
jgi:hypothetical protein